MSELHTHESGSVAMRVVGWVALVTTMVLVLIPVAALTFALEVFGHSMDPTLREGDRLLMDPRTEQVDRFDLVEATLSGQRIVKRVVGLPGDQVRVVPGDKAVTVLLRPAGTEETYRVDNDAWPGQIGDGLKACCNENGESGDGDWATVPDGSYWLIGDNWGGSDDSRTFGFVPVERLGAKFTFRVLPVSSLGTIPNPARLTPVDGETPLAES